MIRFLPVLVLLPTLAHAAPCNSVDDGNLVISSVTPLEWGRFTTPDTNPSSLEINPRDGTRTLASALNINDGNASAFGDVFGAAVIMISGGAGCHVEVSALNPTVSLDAFSFYSVRQRGGTPVRPIVELPAGGVAEVRLGGRIAVLANSTTADVSGAIDVVVEYVADPDP